MTKEETQQVLDSLYKGAGDDFRYELEDYGEHAGIGVRLYFKDVLYWRTGSSFMSYAGEKHLKAAIILSLAKKIEETIDILDGEFHQKALAILAPLWWGNK